MIDDTTIDALRKKLAASEANRLDLEAQIAQANQVSNRFLAAMSHEIRTPLNSIIGMSHLLLASAEDVEQRRRLETVSTSGRHLLTILNDVLDMAKMEAGKLDLEVTPFPLQRVIEEAVEIVGSSAAMKDLDVSFRIHDGVPEGLLGDPGRLRQVVVNLLSNAIKATTSGGIHIDVGADGRQITVDVTDTGCGIPEDAVGRLFQPFEQVDNDGTSRVGGTGLGLAIVRHIVAAMGGDVTVRSAIGNGSTFRFSFRATPARVPELQPTSGVLNGRRILVIGREQVHVDALAHNLSAVGLHVDSFTDSAEVFESNASWDLAIIDDHLGTKRGVHVAKALHIDRPELPVVLLSNEADNGSARREHPNILSVVAKPVIPSQVWELLEGILGGDKPRDADDVFDESLGRRHPLRILVAEDNELNRELAQEYLAAFGYEASYAADGVEAVRMSAEGFDLILMDIEMPNMDGLEATRRIRAAQGDAVRIVAMTAHATANYHASAMDSGMDDVITKPVSPTDLAFHLRCTTRRTLVRPTTATSGRRQAAIIDRLRPRVDQMLERDGPLLVSALETQDHEAARALAHRMRPTVGIIGYHDVAERLQVIDESGGHCDDVQGLQYAISAVLALPA